jgi:hypothetical protein
MYQASSIHFQVAQQLQGIEFKIEDETEKV